MDEGFFFWVVVVGLVINGNFFWGGILRGLNLNLECVDEWCLLATLRGVRIEEGCDASARWLLFPLFHLMGIAFSMGSRVSSCCEVNAVH